MKNPPFFCSLICFLLSILPLAGCGNLKLPPLGEAAVAEGTHSRNPLPPIRPGIPEAPQTATPQPRSAPARNANPDRPRIPLENILSQSDKTMPPVPPAWATTENFLIMGTDRRNGEAHWRTDVIIIVGLDREQRKAVIFSIPRDLHVRIPGSNPGRINLVDYLGERVLGTEGGGPALLAHVIQRNLGIPVDHWIRLEMNGVSELVDAIGGVTVHLACPLYEPIFNLDTNRWEYFVLPAGDVWLDGDDATWFVRLRLRESDIGRSTRQRQLLWALRNQALNMNLLLRFPDLWNAFRNMFETDLSLFEMMDLLRIGVGIDPEQIHSSGLTLADLESFRTDLGAQVLRIADPERVRSIVNGVWEAPSVAGTNPSSADSCPPPPVGLPANPYRTPEPTPTPEVP